MLQFALVAELFEDKPDPNEKKQRAGSHPTQPLRSNNKGGKNMKKTVGSQVIIYQHGILIITQIYLYLFMEKWILFEICNQVLTFYG